jgi:hypothetical protein
MLINRIKTSYRDLINHLDPVQPIVVEPGIRKAANSNGIRQTGMQERRQRRARRMGRVSTPGNFGWNVRAW